MNEINNLRRYFFAIYVVSKHKTEFDIRALS